MKHKGTVTRYFLFIPVLFFLALANVYPQRWPDSSANPSTLPEHAVGDVAVAERYALWGQTAIDSGQWSEALAGLERAADFADLSSDISYLLALARLHENRPLYDVLDALNLALAVDRWKLYKSEDARLERAGILISLKAYSEALSDLARVSNSPRETVLTLKAISASRPWDFIRIMNEALNRYPDETEPVRIFLHFLAKQSAIGVDPGEGELELLNTVLRRLPLLIPKDPELAWMASQYFWDASDATRLVQAYRAVNVPHPASIPVALSLGVIDEETALNELFSPASGTIDLALLEKVWDLLTLDNTRVVFRRNLSSYSGVITEDSNMDDIPETIARYNDGKLEYSSYDFAQGGIEELIIFYESGDPHHAQVFLPPESSNPSRKLAELQWERYPSVREVEIEKTRYIPRPMYLQYTPVLFVELWGSGVLFPRRDPLAPPLTRRVLVTQALRVERPSLEFRGGIEVVELNQGIPVRAREYMGSLMVSETEFLRGRPQLQRVDLDFDGHMETVRHFRRQYRAVELEDLWDFDRDYDYVVSDWEYWNN